MADPSILEGLAEAQAAFRPAIPAKVLGDLLGLPAPVSESAARLVVDIGAGPGHATRALRSVFGPDRPLVAVEPVQDMRRVLLRDMAGDPELQVLDCPAEALGLPDAIAGLIVVNDRYPHLAAPAFLAQALRVLAPGGTLAFVAHAPASEGVVAAMEALVWTGGHGTATRAEVEERSLPADAPLSGFVDITRRSVHWTVERDARGLVDLFLSDPEIWRIVRRLGLPYLMPRLMAVCAAEGLAQDPQPVTMRSRAVVCRRPG